MGSRSRSRSRSPIRWDNQRRERRRRSTSSSSRRRSRGITPRRWAPWRPRDSVEREPSVLLDKPGRINPNYYGVVVKPDIIPEFDPEKSELPALQWLNKIEQLGAIHGWTDNVKSYYMQSRLSGLAKMWHNALRSYEMSWHEWKERILEAFPQNRDYAEVFKEMINRKKNFSETMTHYFYSKCNMLTKCEITGEKAVSCIIDGLPFHLKTPARAGNYRTPGELYSQFLCMNDERKGLPNQRPFSLRGRDNSTPGTSKEPVGEQKTTTSSGKSSVTCFLCKEPGHIVRSCPKNPNAVKCDVCGKTNHKTEQCFRKSINFVNSQVNECYFKNIQLNGSEVRAYLDTGAQVNLISWECSQKLGLDLQPCDLFISGFSGSPIQSCGQAAVEFIIDGIQIESKVVVVNVSLKQADVFIGQPVLNDQQHRLVVSGTTVTLEKIDIKASDKEVFHINAINNETDVLKIKLLCAKETVIPPNTAQFIETFSRDFLQESTLLFVDARLCSYKDVEYSIPSSVYCSPVKSVLVVNHSTKPLAFQKDQLLVRGYVSEESENLASPERNLSTRSILKLDVDKIKCGVQDPVVVQKLTQILQDYSDCFSESTCELGVTNKVELNIELNSDKPVCYRPYRLSFAEKAVMREKIDDMLSNGIIRESSSNYASPIILVRKKNGDFRLCVDFRKLNSITVKDKYPLPIIEEHIEKLGGKKYFTSLDLSQGFYQIPVAKDSIHKTGFVTPEGHYEFLRMPFGLANSPAVFQRLMDRIFSSLRHDKVLPYIDDVLLPTESVEEGLDLLKVVLEIIKEAGLTLNLEKCFFLQTEIEYLGYEISEKGIRPGIKKIEAVSEYKEPNNIHELRMFLGLTSYFRKFVPNYARIAHDLYRLLQKDVSWEWGPEQQKAFTELKKVLTTRPILSIFRRGGDIEVHTDASSKGLAGILLQKQDGKLKPISYFSRKTSREEAMYHSYELETLAVVESLRRFRIYLVGNHFKVVTDCSAVRYTFQKKDLTPRIARWWLLIQEYDMEVEHRPGKSHSHVDALSRCPVEPTRIADINAVDVFDWIVCLQNQDEKIRIIKMKLESGEAESELKNNYKLKEERLYRIIADGTDRLVVPKYGRWNILRKYHDCIGHPGLRRCEKIIKDTFWFPGMTRFIRKYVNACLDCVYKRGQYGRPEGELHPIEKIAEPMHTLHIDHLGPFCKSRAGNSYLLMAVDSFTKFTWAIPVKTTRAREVLWALSNIFCSFGYPKRIVSDSGSCFKSKTFKQFCLDNFIKHVINAVACPRANGQVERYNRTLLDALNTSVDNERDWDNKLPDVTWGMNNLQSSSTGFTPFKLMFSATRSRYQGMTGNSFDDEQTAERTRCAATGNLKRTAEVMRKHFNAKRKRPTKYKVNDLVLWKGAADRNVNVRRKLKEKFSGPYKVSKVVGNDRYVITSLKGVKGYKRFEALVSSDSIKLFQQETDVQESSSDDSQVDSTEELIDLLEG